MILTTISSVTLLFAKGVLNSSGAIGGGAKGVTPGTFFLAGSGTFDSSLLLGLLGGRGGILFWVDYQKNLMF